MPKYLIKVRHDIKRAMWWKHALWCHMCTKLHMTSHVHQITYDVTCAPNFIWCHMCTKLHMMSHVHQIWRHMCTKLHMFVVFLDYHTFYINIFSCRKIAPKPCIIICLKSTNTVPPLNNFIPSLSFFHGAGPSMFEPSLFHLVQAFLLFNNNNFY